MTEALVNGGKALNEAISHAIDWVKDVRRTAGSVNRVADALIEDLRRGRIKSKRLTRAAKSPLSIGIFGISQAGKSFLVDSLAKGANGRLESQMGSVRLDFMKHVNPPGGGKEATGLVTRFTRSASQAPADFPVEVGLLSEADVIKILWNSFMNDFDQETIGIGLDPKDISQLLQGLAAKKQPNHVPGLTEDDVIDLMDYFQRLSRRIGQQLKGNFWPTACEIAPYLLPVDRAKLFGLLWGNIEALSQIYLKLQAALAAVDHAETLYCELACLVERDASGEFSQAKCINNVDILKQLNSDGGDEIRVQPLKDDQPGGVRAIRRGMLAALTTELRFILTERPEAAVLEQVDLLDFPGYRGRLQIKDVNQIIEEPVEGHAGVGSYELLLRGKVGFLFERYTENQEMNLLIMCAPSTKQSDVTTIGAVVDTWVRQAQGETAAIRARRPAGLLTVTTMWDLKLQPAANETPDILRVMGDNVIHMVLERFRNLEWVQNWNGQPFNNIFLARKPGVPGILFAQKDGQEVGVAPSQQARMNQLRDYFLASEEVARHIAQPAEAWDAMLQANDGGVGRIVRYLSETADPSHKQQRIHEQFADLARDLHAKLSVYYRGDAGEAAEIKRQRADKLIEVLSGNFEAQRFPELLNSMMPDTEQMRSIYMRVDTLADRGETPAANGADGKPAAPAPRAGTSLKSLMAARGMAKAESGEAKPLSQIVVSDRARRFADAVTGNWIAQLRAMSRLPGLMRYLAMESEVADMLNEELVAAALRMALPDRMAQTCSAAELVAAKRRLQFVDEQVLIAERVIADFIMYLGGLDHRDLQNSFMPERTVFAVEPSRDGLPELEEGRENQQQIIFMTDWLTMLHQAVVENAGFQEGAEITLEQNARLGGIVRELATQGQ
ncbi:MAG: hypothetical protein E6Q98_14510 [Rhodospirillaceae bacterium]|nr:MAG: hypothetical protein E6Q98_14510 [Rhodospirillaceae bacterium]